LRRSALHLATAWLLAGVGCATADLPRGEGLAPGSWESALYRGHPLVGRVWLVRDRRFVGAASLESALSQADFVLLGETHDNPDHHLLQAQIVAALGSNGRQPALAFEMLQTNQQALVKSALVGSPPQPDAIAAAVDWKHSSWPDFAMYRPVFAAGIEEGFPVLAADLPHESVRRFLAEGSLAFPIPVRRLLDHAGPLAPGFERTMRAEMARAHCGQLPASLLGTLVALQQAREASRAQTLLSADSVLAAKGYEQGAILIACSNPVRTDRAVPAFVSREAPGRTVLAVAFVEVSPRAVEPEDYAEAFDSASLPFDYVVFTPAAERQDPCLDLEKRPHPPPAGQPPALRALAPTAAAF